VNETKWYYCTNRIFV